MADTPDFEWAWSRNEPRLLRAIIFLQLVKMDPFGLVLLVAILSSFLLTYLAINVGKMRMKHKIPVSVLSSMTRNFQYVSLPAF